MKIEQVRELQGEWSYNATLRDVIDGDTVRLDIDLGFNATLRNYIVRLYGINAPEVKGESKELGLKSKEALGQFISIGSSLILYTVKDKKDVYGRILGVLYLDLKVFNSSINRLMINGGFAEEKYW